MPNYHSKTEHHKEAQVTHYSEPGSMRTLCGKYAPSMANVVDVPGDADCKRCRRTIDRGAGEGSR